MTFLMMYKGISLINRKSLLNLQNSNARLLTEILISVMCIRTKLLFLLFDSSIPFFLFFLFVELWVIPFSSNYFPP